MKPVGQPQLDDQAARVDRAVNGALGRILKLYPQLIPERAALSEPMSPEAMKYDYMSRRNDSAALGQKLQELQAMKGFHGGMREFLKYVEDLERG